MAIVAPEVQDGMDLGRSRISPADIYAPQRPVYDDSNARELAASLGKLSQPFFDQDEENLRNDMAKKDYWVNKVYNSLDTKATEDDINNLSSDAHPKVRAAVAEAYGERIGEQWAMGQFETPPEGYDGSPEATKAWVDTIRKKAAEQWGNSPFIGAGAMRSVERYAISRQRQEDSTRSEAWKKELEANRENTFYLGAENGKYEPSAAPSPTKAKAIVDAAAQLGIDAGDLATVISYESGFRTNIWGGRGGKYQGLIQFGPEERRQFGVTGNETFEEQMPKVVAYLKARGFKPGMSILQLYKTINGGNPYVSDNASDGNGTIVQHVARMQAAHRRRALAFLGAIGDDKPKNVADKEGPESRPEAKGKTAAVDTGTKTDASTDAPADVPEVVPGKDSPMITPPLPPRRPADLTIEKDAEKAKEELNKADGEAKPDADQPPTRETPFKEGDKYSDLPKPPDLEDMKDDDATWVMTQRRFFFQQDEKWQKLSWFTRAQNRDAAARAYARKAVDTADSRWLRILPKELLTPDIRDQFDKAQNFIDHKNRADLAEQRRIEKEQHDAQMDEVRRQMDRMILEKKDPTGEDFIRWGQLDPKLPTEFNDRKNALNGPFRDQIKREDQDEAERLKNEMRDKIMQGEDISNYKIETIRDPDIRKDVLEEKDKLQRDGGELRNEMYRKDMYQAGMAPYGYIDQYGMVKITDPNGIKAKVTYERMLVKMLRTWRAENPTRNTPNDMERADIAEKAWQLTYKIVPPPSKPTDEEGSGGNNTPNTSQPQRRQGDNPFGKGTRKQ